MRKPKRKMILVEARMIRKAAKLLTEQQSLIHELMARLEKEWDKNKRKRRARNTQPTDAGVGMSGIQMGN